MNMMRFFFRFDDRKKKLPTVNEGPVQKQISVFLVLGIGSF